MTRRVHWLTLGTGQLDGLTGSSIITDQDVLPVTAALRDLQRACGLEVVAFGGTPCRRPGRGMRGRGEPMITIPIVECRLVPVGELSLPQRVIECADQALAVPH